MDIEKDPSKDIAILEGSTRSTKTYSIIQYLIINHCVAQAGSTVRCFRFDSVTHNGTTIADFKEIMMTLDLWDEGSWNGTEKIFRFTNGSEFAFSATSDPQKLHGLKQKVAYFNEVMEIDEDAYTQVAYRTTDLQDNCAYQHSTYKDNPFLSELQIKSIEQYEPTPENKKRGTANAWKWDVYGLGKRGKVEGAVFELFGVTEFFPARENCQRWGMGLDFGFSLDPTALVECALFQDELYVREWIYKQGLVTTTNVTRPNEPSIEGNMREVGVSDDVKIYADCSAPQQIADLGYSGFNVIPCVKGAGSILQGIDLMKQRKIFIHKDSNNLQLEFEHYRWKSVRAKGGEMGFKREPEDKNNHAIDAVRYWAMAELQIAKFERSGGMRPRKSKSIRGRVR
jgi:phage terminase large subunit